MGRAPWKRVVQEGLLTQNHAYKGIPFVGQQPVGSLRRKAPVDIVFAFAGEEEKAKEPTEADTKVPDRGEYFNYGRQGRGLFGV